MKLKADVFPYPVLSKETDDFSSGLFSMEVEEKERNDSFVKLLCTYTIENDDIEELLKNNKANIAMLLEGQSSSYRKLVVFGFDEREKEIVIEAKDVSRKVFVNSFILASEDLVDYTNTGFNQDYYGDDFKVPLIEKGSLLAYDTPVDILMTFSNSETASLESIVRVAKNVDNDRMIVNCDESDAIKVELPGEAYDVYYSLSHSDKALESILRTALILPALTYTIERIQSKTANYEGNHWYEDLQEILESKGLTITEEPDAMEIAQALLNNPVEKSLVSFKNYVEGDER